MTLINAVIIDDEPLAREGLKGYIEKTEGIQCVMEFPNAMKGRDFLENEHYDVLFLDINMPGISGIEFIRNYSINHPVVFVTAYREFALESYELSAFDYLLKPLTYPRFLK